MQPPRDDRGNSVEVALVAAARSLSSRLDVPGVADALLAAVDHVFGASSSWVLLHDDREGRLKTVAYRSADADAFRDVEMPANGGIMGLAFSSRQVVFVPDAQADDRWFDAARVHRTGLRSAFAVPLVCQDRALGVVGLDTPRFNASEPPGRADVARLEALAGQAAVAIRNAELFEASERDRRRMAALLDERRGLRRRVATLQEEVRAAGALQLVGASEMWQETVRLADIVAAGDTTVLLLGETGTGKELLARRIHDHSGRADGPFVTVNCAALPDALVERELFGHEKGAFTGANARKPGRFERADGGTLFLDEIGDLPGDAQAELLRVLQDSRLERVGGTATITVDVRLIARHEQGSRQRHRRAQLPLRSVFSARRLSRLAPGAARSARRHSDAGAPLSPGVRAQAGAAGPARQRRGDAAAARVSVAGQRPRAAERHGTRRDSLQRGGRSTQRDLVATPAVRAAGRPGA